MKARETSPRSIPAAERVAILLDPCYYCGSFYPEVVDHADPVAQGGGTEPGNLVPACWRCNAEKSDRTPSQWRHWRIKQNYPWPPPNTDDAVFDAVLALSENQGEVFARAMRWQDARVLEALDMVRDRVWVGEDGSAADDAAEISRALVGAETRYAGTRTRQLRDLVKLAESVVGDHDDAVARLIADPVNAPFSLHMTWDQGKRRVAVALAEFVSRFLAPEETLVVGVLLGELSDWTALHGRILETGRRAADFAGCSASDDTREHVAALLREQLADRLARFADLCSEKQRRTLQALVGEVSA